MSYKEIESVVGYTFIDQNGIIDIFDNTNGMNIPLLAKRFEAFAEQNESRFNSIFDKTLNELKENNMEKHINSFSMIIRMINSIIHLSMSPLMLKDIIMPIAYLLVLPIFLLLG